MNSCYCGSGIVYSDCCEPIITGVRAAETAEQLMRARYAAFVGVQMDFIFETTHPDQRQGYDHAGTKEWAENNYYRLPIEAQGPELVAINGFWRDFAAWDGRTPFLSTHVAEAHHNFTEMMLALAVLDLPFEAPVHATKTEIGRAHV